MIKDNIYLKYLEKQIKYCYHLTVFWKIDQLRLQIFISFHGWISLILSEFIQSFLKKGLFREIIIPLIIEEAVSVAVAITFLGVFKLGIWNEIELIRNELVVYLDKVQGNHPHAIPMQAFFLFLFNSIYFLALVEYRCWIKEEMILFE